jgi:hypothetical protein
MARADAERHLCTWDAERHAAAARSSPAAVRPIAVELTIAVVKDVSGGPDSASVAVVVRVRAAAAADTAAASGSARARVALAVGESGQVAVTIAAVDTPLRAPVGAAPTSAAAALVEVTDGVVDALRAALAGADGGGDAAATAAVAVAVGATAAVVGGGDDARVAVKLCTYSRPGDYFGEVRARARRAVAAAARSRSPRALAPPARSRARSRRYLAGPRVAAAVLCPPSAATLRPLPARAHLDQPALGDGGRTLRGGARAHRRAPAV